MEPDYKTAGAGDRAIVFLHGLGGDKDNFDDQLAALPDGWRALAWNMPGNGGSPPLPAMTFGALAAAVVAMLDAEGVDRAVVLGHSMGGMVAQEVAARYPERVAGLVLFATAPAFGGQDDSFKARFLAERLAPLDAGKTPADIAPAVVGAMFCPATSDAVKARAAASMSAIPVAVYRASLQCIVTFDRRDALERIACPTLVLAGESDALSPPRTMARMAERIPGATYRCLPGMGHLANFEDPAAFNAVLVDFLNSLD
jgi:3-oxoadipate enol-lactonase